MEDYLNNNKKGRNHKSLINVSTLKLSTSCPRSLLWGSEVLIRARDCLGLGLGLASQTGKGTHPGMRFLTGLDSSCLSLTLWCVWLEHLKGVGWAAAEENWSVLWLTLGLTHPQV